MADLLDSGRKTIFTILRELQSEGRKIAISFLTGFILTIVSIRAFAWSFFETVMRSGMTEELGQQIDIIARNPFEVLLVQAKISLLMGVAFTIPALIYIAKKRFINGQSKQSIPIYAYIVTILTGIVLFVLGLWYSYYIFFPVIFEFLASATVQTGIEPMYSIAKWTQFMILLSLSFGLLAQVPVSIPTLVRYNLLSYQGVKDGFRYWIVGTLCVGAVLSPPEPISQLLWSGPLIFLYSAAIVISKYIDPHRYDLPSNNTGSEEVEDDVTDDEMDMESFNTDEFGPNYDKLVVIGEALKRNTLLLMAVFLITGIVSFYAQFIGGTKFLIDLVTGSTPVLEDVRIVALHPVEVLMFQAKMSVFAALTPTVLIALWKVWPDMRSDNIVRISRSNMITYIFVPIVTLIIGGAIGLFYLTPPLLEFLVSDAARINANISYQISSFFWIVLYIIIISALTVGTYISMLYWYLRGIGSSVFTNYWRHVVFGVLVFSIVITPDSISKSLLFMLFPTVAFMLGVWTIRFIEYIRD